MSDLNLWHKRLKAKHDAGTLEDLQEAHLLAILDMRNNLIYLSEKMKELTESHQHVEGIVGTVDQFLQAVNGPLYPGYQRGTFGSGLPVHSPDTTPALTEGT